MYSEPGTGASDEIARKILLTFVFLALPSVRSPRSRHRPAAVTYTALPAHVYAPYYETFLAPSTQHHRHRAGLWRKVLHASVPAGGYQRVLRAGLEQQLDPAPQLLQRGHRLTAGGRRRVIRLSAGSAPTTADGDPDSCTSVSQIAAELRAG